MIGPSREWPLPAGLGGSTPAAAPPPWEGRQELACLAFATLASTGPDPGRDRLVRLAAWRRAADGRGWEAFERLVETPPEGTSAARSRGPAQAAWGALARFLHDRRVLVLDRAPFLAWARALTGDEEPPFAVWDLVGWTRLLLPGRLAGAGEGLCERLLGRARGAPLGALEPGHLHAALGALCGRVLAGGEERLALLALGLARVAAGLARSEPRAALELAFALQLLEHPSSWRDAPAGHPAPHAALDDGRLSDAVRAWDALEDAIDAAVPAWTRRLEDDPARGSMPEALEEEVTLDAADRALVDQAFEEHVPRAITASGGAAAYRPGQHAVAREIAQGFGTRELFLVHAPTGTGKTLAYLVPAMLWSLRNGVRVGVATYTRALQEQAMERDVPLARDVLARAGVAAHEDQLRVALLKGRQNYLCWRSLRLSAPASGSPPLDELAWLMLALFALEEEDGDFDRLPLAAPLAALDGTAWTTALSSLVRTCRGEPRCCTAARDRDTCGAEVARRRAERAHVVLTNHAFAFARREFFRLVVFDECEHLHDVAHNTFSRTVTTRALAELLQRFHKQGGRRAVLNRVERMAELGSPAWNTTRQCIAAREQAGAALIRLEGELYAFEAWREERLGERKEDDAHSLFREYALTEADAEGLHAAQHALHLGLEQLDAGCARLAEHLETLATRNVARVRRQLEVLRGDLAERREAVEAWIPRDDQGLPSFRRDTFYDLEERPNGDRVLAARVLLPHEFLGRQYYPDLFGAILISATTWLKDGFDAQATYLGLTRAASPAPDEDRFACTVRTFRAPETFDYSRVLVGVPRDAVGVHEGKAAYLGYVARVIAYLAERTRGRLLALFTNSEDVAACARLVEPFFRARRLSFFWQGQPGATKEELSGRFRERVDSVLFGLDTFWYGADFPGETLEHLVIVRLPYGVPDRYHHAQCAALGRSEQRRQVYMPRALAKLRQGFGRLMRKESDRGTVLVLDKRLVDPRHRPFLRELPLRGTLEGPDVEHLARLVRADSDAVLRAALAHVHLLGELRDTAADAPFQGWRL